MSQYEGTSKVNIVSLGAGFDSTYFWLKRNYANIDSKIDFIEIDFISKVLVEGVSHLVEDASQFHSVLLAHILGLFKFSGA